MDEAWGRLTVEKNNEAYEFNSCNTKLNHQKISSIMLPTTSSVREEEASITWSTHDAHRVSLCEMDFFLEKNQHVNAGKALVEMENSYDEAGKSDVNTSLQLASTANDGSNQSAVEDRNKMSSSPNDNRAQNELAHTQSELERIAAENQHLKEMLTRVSSNYTTLQVHLVTLMESRTDHRTQEHEIDRKSEEKNHGNGGSIISGPLVDFGPSADTLGKQSICLEEEKTFSESPQSNIQLSNKRIGREESLESEVQNPSKAPRTNTFPFNHCPKTTMRKARVSIRARSEAPIISDGCQWRKYGQKLAKGNPCPRAYYRCTMAIGCLVRKQVQRCAEDQTILITTYEGNHNHPLPPAAMAIASTTSAAATMLLSGPMPSGDAMMSPNIFHPSAILPCSSNNATISVSASAPFPTITLDLTQSANSLQSQISLTQFQTPFSLDPQNFNLVPTQIFDQPLYDKSKFLGSQMSHYINEAQQVSQFHQPQLSSQSSFSKTLTATTSTIATDPNFVASLASIISSIIGGSQTKNSY